MTPKKKRFYIIFSAFSFFCFIVGAFLIILSGIFSIPAQKKQLSE